MPWLAWMLPEPLPMRRRLSFMRLPPKALLPEFVPPVRRDVRRCVRLKSGHKLPSQSPGLVRALNVEDAQPLRLRCSEEELRDPVQETFRCRSNDRWFPKQKVFERWPKLLRRLAKSRRSTARKEIRCR